MYRLLVISCLLLAACSPVVVTVPAAGGELLPEQIQRAADAYTATARVQATQAAAATGAAVSARETSTAAALGTLSALAVHQTESALQLTQLAGAAVATDQAAAKTQAAAQTYAWATPTFAAIRTQAALELALAQSDATVAAARAVQAQADADGRAGVFMAAALAVFLGLAALFAVAVFYLQQREEARLSVLKDVEFEKVERARADTERAKIEAIKACIVEREGRPFLLTPGGRLVPMLEGPQPTTAGHRHRWLSAIKRAVYAGIELGLASGGKPRFGERDLAGERGVWIVNADGTPNSTGYRQINQILRRAGVWTTAGRDTAFAREWTAARFEQEIDLLHLELPEGEPPDVRIPPRSSPIPAIPAVSAVPQSPES